MTARGQSYSTNDCKRAAFYRSCAGVHVEKSWSSHDSEVLSLLLCLQEIILFYFQGCCSIMEPDLWPLYIECKTAVQGEMLHSSQSPTETHTKNMSYFIKSFNLLLRHLWNISSGQILVLHSFQQDTGVAWGVVPATSVFCSVHIHSSFFQLGKVTPQRPTWPSLQRSSHLHCWCTPAEESQDLLWSPAPSSAPRWWQTGGELCCHGAAPPDGGQAHQRPQTYHPGISRTLGESGMNLLCWTDRAHVWGCCWEQCRGGAPRPAGGCWPAGHSSELSCSGNLNTNILPIQTNSTELSIPTLHRWW